MLSKKASLLLLIGISAWLLNFFFREIYYAFTYDSYRTGIMSWLITFVYFLAPVSLIPLAVAGLKQQFGNRKTIGMLIAIAGGLWLAYLLYSRVRWLMEPGGYSGLEKGLLPYLVFQWLGMLPAITTLLFGIGLIDGQTVRLKRNAAWFVAGGLTYLFSHFGFCLQEYILFSDLRQPEGHQSIGLLLIVLTLLYPVGLIAAGLSVIKHIPSAPERETTIQIVVPEKETPPRVVDWFENYLLSGIPILGPILLFAWGIDHSNRIRRNWALTFFLALILRTLLNLIVFVPFVLFSGIGYQLRIDIDENDYLTFAWTVIFGLIAAGGVLLALHFNKKPDVRDPEDPNPGIGTWIANFFILAVPLVGIVCLFVWATDNRNAIIRKWAAARLIWGATLIVLSLYMYVWIREIIRIQSEFVYFQF